MTAVLTDPEIQSLRRHLEWGNISVGGYPYTPDGFYEVFVNVVSPNLQTGAETTATTATVANAVTTVTPVSMTGIAVNTRLVVDVGDDAEIVVVKSLPTGASFSARFAVAHPASGYPIAVQSGLAELRMLIHSADRARAAMNSGDVTASAGLQSLDKADVVFANGGRRGNAMLGDLRAQYDMVIDQIAALVRVPRNFAEESSGSSRLENY